jgi:DNA-binding CsgD family transcriptional regulator
MNDEDILHVQRSLRARLFEGGSAIRWRPGRELAAQLLLYLDDPEACWRLTTEWLRETLDADRVDGGFGGFVGAGGAPRDYVVIAESQRPGLRLPAVMNRRFEAADPALRAVWGQRGLLAFDDVSQAGMPAAMRGTLQSLGTAAKVALPVHDGERPIGILCADWHREAPRWNEAACLEASRFTHAALGALMGAAQRLGRRVAAVPVLPQATVDVPDSGWGQAPAAWHELTPAEQRVAKLVAFGLSYKEVARRLDRSPATIDHQLRSIRQKLGVASTSRLVRLLSGVFEASGARE